MNHYTSSNFLDVIIVCAGPKGLSAALLLGRSLKQVLVIESGKPRDAVYHLACFQTLLLIACWIGEIFLMGEGLIARSWFDFLNIILDSWLMNVFAALKSG